MFTFEPAIDVNYFAASTILKNEISDLQSSGVIIGASIETIPRRCGSLADLSLKPQPGRTHSPMGRNKGKKDRKAREKEGENEDVDIQIVEEPDVSGINIIVTDEVSTQATVFSTCAAGD